jgi:hypothetical protein
MDSWLECLIALGVVYVTSTTHDPRLSLGAKSPLLFPALFGLQGFLDKRGGKINTAFQRRFFRVAREENGAYVLQYFLNSDDTVPKGSVPLSGCRVVHHVANSGYVAVGDAPGAAAESALADYLADCERGTLTTLKSRPTTSGPEAAECEFSLESPARRYDLRSISAREKLAWAHVLWAFIRKSPTSAPIHVERREVNDQFE